MASFVDNDVSVFLYVAQYHFDHWQEYGMACICDLRGPTPGPLPCRCTVLVTVLSSRRLELHELVVAVSEW